VWEVSAPNYSGTFKTEDARLKGHIKYRNEGKDFSASVDGTKKNAVLVDMYLDPRIQEKIQVRVLESSFPEITNVSMNYWPLIHNGDCVDFTKALDGPNWEGDTKWRDTFLPGTLDWYSEGGRVYGIPFGYYAYVFWYNKAM